MNTTIHLFGISGSPRAESTDFVIKTALQYAEKEYAAQTFYFSCHKKELHFCIHCDYCIKKKQGCVFTDDMQEVYKRMEWANALLIGTPVYQGTLSGQTKVLLDRCRAVVAKNPAFLAQKAGAAVAVGGDRIGGQEPAVKAIFDFYVINEMIPVGGGSFGANLGGTFWSKDKGVKGVKEDEEGLKSLYKTMDNLMKVAALLRR